MSTSALKARRRERAHQILVVVLVVLLASFAVWCLAQLVRAEKLQSELDLYFGWIDEIRDVRAELARLRELAADRSADGGEAPEIDVGAAISSFHRRVEGLERHSVDPELSVTVQNLRLTLTPLLEGESASPEALWQASVAALAATEAFESRIRGQISRIHQRLGGHWRSLYLLVVGTLLLAGSNLGLLFLAHRRRRELESAHVRALKNASHDSLTGMWNREGILRLLGHELVRAMRSRAPLGVILADIDHFKEVNALLGQDQGDYILEQVGQRLQSLVRPYDTMGRYGGDSFLVVLPSCDGTAVVRVAERLRQAVNSRDVEHAHGHIRITVSIAQVTVKRPGETDVDTLLRELTGMLDAEKGRVRPLQAMAG